MSTDARKPDAVAVLKRCPFCKELPAKNSTYVGSRKGTSVHCASCKAEGPACSGFAEAAVAWNRRAVIAEQPAPDARAAAGDLRPGLERAIVCIEGLSRNGRSMPSDFVSDLRAEIDATRSVGVSQEAMDWATTQVPEIEAARASGDTGKPFAQFRAEVLAKRQAGSASAGPAAPHPIAQTDHVGDVNNMVGAPSDRGAAVAGLVERLRAPIDWGHFVSDDHMRDYADLLHEAADALDAAPPTCRPATAAHNTKVDS